MVHSLVFGLLVLDVAPDNLGIPTYRIYWDMTLVEDPLEWVFEQLENRKLGAMIERAGYPGIAADLDLDTVASVLPAMKKRAFAMYAAGEALTGHKGLPLEPTPNLAAD